FSERAHWFRFLDRDGTTSHQQECCYRFTAWSSLYLPLRDALGEESYHLGYEVVDFQVTDDEVTLEFAAGDSETTDLLVGADGISSTARSLLAPVARPVFAGYLGWRGVVRESQLDEIVFKRLHEAITYFTPERSHILSYPIPNPSEGERLLNYVWYRNIDSGFEQVMTDARGETRQLSVPPGLVPPLHVDNLRVEAEELLPPDLAAMVLATQHPFIQAVVDVEVGQMAFGRVCLLGDAAFAARPHAAAGTAKAAADAWDLVATLKAIADIRKGLAAWESRALRRGRQLVARARRLGELAQVKNQFRGDDPEVMFGLERAGDSCFDN
ncbi:MAG TPA: monooxygenase, partial [Acidimicrobiia bacterium]|nr:monooxygenase [Acidimicrobiia bacterium]